MTRVDKKLNDIESEVTEIKRQLEVPSLVDQYAGTAKDSFDNFINTNVPKVCFAGKEKRKKCPKWANIVFDLFGLFLVIIGVAAFCIGIPNSTSWNLFGAFLCVLGFGVWGTSPSKLIGG
ncbi:MAG: hypothetical protein PHN90_13850 [Methanothrix sp.]|jgi:hypothetical protein|nr:hypothetical protein [Methanothrix sp.]